MIETPSTAQKFSAGMTMFIPSGPTGDHLFVIIVDVRIVGNQEKILMAPIETIVPKSDLSCCLGIGDHPFVQHASHIGYRHCRVDNVSDISKNLQSGYFRAGDPVSSDLLAKIQNGFRLSNQVKRFIKGDWLI